jgi:hypothetical protein
VKRFGLIAALVLLAIAFALWPDDELPSSTPSVAPSPSVTTAPAVPSPEPEAPAEEEVALEEESEAPAESEGLTIDVVRLEACDAGETGDPTCEVPLPGIALELRQPEDGGLVARGTSDLDGAFTLTTLEPGAYDAYVADPNLISEPQTVDYRGEPTTLTLVVSKPARFELRVVSPSGERIPNADVELAVKGNFIHDGKTDESGLFRVERSASGLAELLVRAPGYADARDLFVVEGDVSKTVTLQRGRTVTVHVHRPPNGPKLMVNLSAGGDDWKGITIGPRVDEARFTDMPPKPLLLMVSEAISAGVGSYLTRPVGPGEDDVTVTLGGPSLLVKVEGPRPKSGFARGVCCAAHYVELRCDDRPLRRKMLNVPGEVTFDYLPSVPCWVSYDDGPEKRATPPEVTLHTD